MKPKTKKKNPQDLTLRNLRAMKKYMEKMAAALFTLMIRIEALEAKKK